MKWSGAQSDCSLSLTLLSTTASFYSRRLILHLSFVIPHPPHPPLRPPSSLPLPECKSLRDSKDGKFDRISKVIPRRSDCSSDWGCVRVPTTMQEHLWEKVTLLLEWDRWCPRPNDPHIPPPTHPAQTKLRSSSFRWIQQVYILRFIGLKWPPGMRSIDHVAPDW